jgi:outer membrane protein assembly factor BamB/predicted phosphohydrolase
MRKYYIFFLLPFIFTTLMACTPVKDEIHRFVILTDIHVMPGTESSEQLKAIVQEINLGDSEMVIITGDLSNQGSDEELRNVKSILDELKVPYYIIPGNHEMNWSESAGQTFATLWGDDKFIFQKGKFLFVGINTGPFMRMGDGHIKQEDLRWLRRELDNRMKPGMKLLFFAHYPLAEGLDQWYLATEILQKYNTVAAFCGHGHQMNLLSFDGIPGIMGRSMVLRGENIPGYNLIELSQDSIWVTEKIAKEPKGVPAIWFALQNPSPMLLLSSSPMPEYTVNTLFPDISPVWQYSDTASVFTGPIVVGDTLVIYGNSSGWIKAIGVPSGTILWEKLLDGPLYSTPALTNQHTIIAADPGGNIWCFDVMNGNIIWQKNTGAAIVAPPLVDGAHFYLGTGKNGMYKMKVADGEIVWSFNDVSGLIQAMPALHNNRLVFTAWDTHLYCLDSQTGKLIWKWNNGKTAPLLSPGNVVPVIQNNTVFIVAPDRYMTAISPENGQQLWRSAKHQVRESMGHSAKNNMVFAKLMNDSVIAVSTQTPGMETKWVKDAGFGYDHNPCPVLSIDNIIYTATRNGLIISMREVDGEIRWKHKVGNSSINFFFEGESKYVWFTTTDGNIYAMPK